MDASSPVAARVRESAASRTYENPCRFEPVAVSLDQRIQRVLKERQLGEEVGTVRRPVWRARATVTTCTRRANSSQTTGSLLVLAVRAPLAGLDEACRLLAESRRVDEVMAIRDRAETARGVCPQGGAGSRSLRTTRRRSSCAPSSVQASCWPRSSE